MEWLGTAGLIAVGAFLGGFATYLRLLPKLAAADETIRQLDNAFFAAKEYADTLVAENRRLRRAQSDILLKQTHNGNSQHT